MIAFLGRCLRWSARGALALVVAAAATWLVGRVVTDRFAWSQWIFWVPTLAVLPLPLLAAGLVPIAVPAGRGQRLAFAGCGVALLALLVHLTFVSHHLLRGRPDDPVGHKIVQWTFGETVSDEQIAQVLASEPMLDADLLIVVDGASALLERQWRWNHERRRTMRHPRQAWLDRDYEVGAKLPFAYASRLPVHRYTRLAREAIFTPDEFPELEEPAFASVALLEVASDEVADRVLSILLVDLPSEPILPRYVAAGRTRAIIERLEDDGELGDVDLIVGDLNMTRGGAAMAVLAPGFRHAYDEAGFGYAATYFGRHPRAFLHLDHALLAPTVRCTSYETAPIYVRRHLPQVMWITGRDPEGRDG